ncbi:hypothetical protein [Hyphomicrobium zavarzinii]|uniref:hypothetical protein n=1 Tax=Hyphomicrobium zavarzinii TaxID=48292 RepID=UPI0012EB1DA2|nr:hypothetical protein [Hyphomicrobium zavarzinii]
MKKLSNTFLRFADEQQKFASNPNTLAFIFCLSAAVFPFSSTAAIGAAVSPTLAAGSALIARAASKLINALG